MTAWLRLAEWCSPTLRLAFPIFVSNLLGVSFAVIDTYFIGLIPDSHGVALAGVGLIFPFLILVVALAMSLQNGVSSVAARLVGSGQAVQLRRVMRAGFAIAIAESLILGILLAFAPAWLTVLAGSGSGAEPIIEAAVHFAYGVGGGLLATPFFRVYLGLLIASGHEGLTMRAAFVLTIANLVLDPLLIFWADLGIFGAGFATTISVFITIGYLYFCHRAIDRPTNELDSADELPLLQITKNILGVGIPNLLNLGATTVQNMGLNYLILPLGTAAMASWSAVSRFDQFILMPLSAFYAATLVQVGQAYGAKEFVAISGMVRRNLLIGVHVTLVISLAYLLLAPWLIVTTEWQPTTIASLMVEQIRLMAFIPVLMVLGSIVTATFQAVGLAWVPSIITIATRIFVCLGIGYFLIPRLGLIGVYVALWAAMLVQATLNLTGVSLLLSRIRASSVSRERYA